ncbi:hypothetical protein Pst134EA_002502 [Puccinia striiformis f. sp. tritici]|uniref:hypothetical protein n=1 Tax=Puccinia striiformis f. sp. tritici TaxID=168172 RepID=UPI0020089DAE|nr:hypothetical protein Pst134EA_002502 [Puccinia striiformis f. sp. tritici]KAH9471870.1 hypothetical protein Pst134EA_002502 [Puccinia striiformis f. sp. tritici]
MRHSTKTIIDQSKTAASSASFLFGRDGLLSTQSLKNPNDVRTDRLTTCILSEMGSYPLYWTVTIQLDPPLLGIRINHNNDCPWRPSGLDGILRYIDA